MCARDRGTQRLQGRASFHEAGCGMADFLPLSSAKKRRKDAPGEHVERVAWLLMQLFFHESVEYALYFDRFGRPRRRFQDDLKKLREIGQRRYTISPRTKGGRVFITFPSRTGMPNRTAASRDAMATLAHIASALGGPIEQELRTAIGDSVEPLVSAFLQVRGPFPSADDRITSLFEALKEAASDSARIEFSYRSNRNVRTTRRAEPYHVIVRNGRYYLVAYDLLRRDWRYFALDAIGGKIRKDGTFTRRPVPARRLAQRAVGWISGSNSTDVTFHVSPVAAAAATACLLQPGQRIVRRADGSAELTLSFDDLGEAVRWALQFAPEAVIVAPREAIALARDTAQRVAEAHGAAAGARELTG